MRPTLKRMTLLKLNAGFSLIEIMMAMGMASVVGLGAAYVVQTQVRLQRDAVDKMDLSAAHAVALQQARNLEFVGQHVVLNGSSRNAFLDRCLMGKLKAGENCSSMGSMELPAEALPIYLPAAMNTSSSSTIRSRMSAQRVCNAAVCSKVVVRVVTARMNRDTASAAGGNGGGTGGGTEARRLTTDVEFPGLAFVPTEQVDFTCAGGSVLTGVDTQTRNADCTPVVNNLLLACASTSNGPMRGFGNVMSNMGDSEVCNRVRSRVCPSGSMLQAGVSSIGAGSATIECGSISSLAPPPTPTPTPTPAPPTNILCYSRNVGFGGRTGCDNTLEYFATAGDCDAAGRPVTLCNRPPFTSACHAVRQGDPDASSCTGFTPPVPPANACTWTQTNDDPAGCNTPNNNRLFLTLSGVQSSIGYQNLNQAQRALPTNATAGDTAAYCGVCTRLACRFVEWSCQSTTAPVADPPTTPPAAGCYPDFEVYFGWTCPGPTESVSMRCPTGQGAPQQSYGSHSAPAQCNVIPSSTTWVPRECRTCTPTTPPVTQPPAPSPLGCYFDGDGNGQRTITVGDSYLGRGCNQSGGCVCNGGSSSSCSEVLQPNGIDIRYTCNANAPAPSGDGDPCTCGTVNISGRNWSPCGGGQSPGYVQGNQCIIDAWESNFPSPYVECRMSNPEAPMGCAYTPPPPRAQACTPGSQRADRHMCCQDGNSWSSTAMPRISGAAEYRFCGCGNNPEFSPTRLPNGDYVNDGC